MASDAEYDDLSDDFDDDDDDDSINGTDSNLELEILQLKPFGKPSSSSSSSDSESESKETCFDDGPLDQVENLLTEPGIKPGAEALPPTPGDQLTSPHKVDEARNHVWATRLASCIHQFDMFAMLHFEDITSLTMDGNVSLICGDSLLLSAMKNDYSVQNGGQLLHLVYLCERLIQLLQRKSGIFEVVFFDIWQQLLPDESMSLARSTVSAHLQRNANVNVHSFTATWDPGFKQLINILKPSFLIMDLALGNVLSSLGYSVNVAMLEVLIHCQVMHTLTLELPCVSLEKVELGVSLIHAFVVERRSWRSCRFPAVEYLKKITGKNWQQNQLVCAQLNPVSWEDGVDIRHVVTVLAAAWYLCGEQESHAENWIRAYLLYSAWLEVLPLSRRACVVPRENPTRHLSDFIKKIQCYMNLALVQCQDGPYSHCKVSDIWHGNLFVAVLRHLSSLPSNSGVNDLGIAGECFQQLIEEVQTASGRTLMKFPIVTNDMRWFETSLIPREESASPETKLNTKELVKKLLPVSCVLSREFCGDLMDEICQQVSEFDSKLTMFRSKENSYSEIHHWHSLKPLTDEHDRIKTEKAHGPESRVRNERMRMKYAKFMAIYGASIEGRRNDSKTIVCKNPKEKKQTRYTCKKEDKDAGKGKVSQVPKKVAKEKPKSKKDMIIEANLRRKDEAARKAEGALLSRYSENFKRWKGRRDCRAALEEAKILRKSLTVEENICRALMYEAKCCSDLWFDECRSCEQKSDRDLTPVKELFLVLREILTRSKEKNVDLSDDDKAEIGKLLWLLGFGEVACQWELPRPSKNDRSFEVGLSWARFQLLYLGPDLKTETEGTPDYRVDFIPDPWQRDLFDIIDRRESAVIVAPTSSGKTYACYYCMESILRDDNDGVVLYVSPTKALVNQVAATVYSRFKGKTMPEGKSVYGVFTRDYRTNEMNSQILITVPQCLEMLLLSPRKQAWVRKLRYIIFDEIHCLAGQAGGISWETSLLMIRCPFLALSATVGNPETFHRWLQDAENFKKQRDQLDGCERASYKVHLVIHSDRHSDLKKYIYSAEGEMIHIHPYALIDESVIREHNGIPAHISLAAVEVLQLYLGMEAASQMDCSMVSLQPETCFADKSFLTRNQVKKYENKLRDCMQVWARERPNTFKAVTTWLRKPLEMANITENGLRFIRSNFLKFIEKLRHSDMFPTIFFRYDRGDIDYLFKEFVNYCLDFEEDELKIGNSQNVKISDNGKKAMKSVSKSCGRAEDVMDTNARANDFRVKTRGPAESSRTLGLLEESSSVSIRNIGQADKDDVKFVERRLLQLGYKWTNTFPSGLRYGLGKHHSAMNAKERSAVEMLFRMKVLNGVLATGTLSLGIHMPCKTVVIGGNSIYLDTLSYHQMSGRAGRRGFDTEGNVIFFGLGERKIRTLLTRKLPALTGNFPLTVTMVLRLLLLVADVSEKGRSQEDAQKNAISRALTFLNCSLVYQNIPELKDQMKHFLAFSTQLLTLQGVLDPEGKPNKMCGIITHLHYHEPGNLVLVYLLRSGALRRLCEAGNGEVTKEVEMNLVLVLSHLFARLPLHPSREKTTYKNSIVVLPPLPETVAADVQLYNDEVEFMYDHYFRCAAKHVSRTLGEDDKLPLSGVCFGPSEPLTCNTGESHLQDAIVGENVPRTVCSRFAALSGHRDEKLYSKTNLISNIRHQVFTDIKAVPFLDFSIQLNGYAWDFYNHGIVPSIIKDNGIRAGDAYNLLNDFRLMLTSVTISLDELGIGLEKDPLMQTFQKVSFKFQDLFNRGFSIKEHI